MFPWSIRRTTSKQGSFSSTVTTGRLMIGLTGRVHGMAPGHHLGPQVRIRDDPDGLAAWAPPPAPRSAGPATIRPAVSRMVASGDHGRRGRAADLPHLGREQEAVAAAEEQALPLDLPGGHLHVLREVELEQVLRDGRVAAHQFVQSFPGKQVADGVLHGDDGGLLVAAHKRYEPEGLPSLPVVADLFLSATLGPDGDLDHALLDDPQ